MDVLNNVAFTVEIGSDSLPVQVLKAVYGVRNVDVTEMAIPVQLPAGGQIQVLHPVLILECRIANIDGLHRHDQHSLEQARISVRVAREFLRTLASEGYVKDTLVLSERIFKFARSNPFARNVFIKFDIDPFAAVYPWPTLPDAFREKRFPQMQAQLRTRRSGW